MALLVAAFAAGGLLLSQTAYRGGLGGPLAMVTLANPLAAAVIGLALLGERLQGGPAGVLLALAGAGLASWGVVLLSRAAPAAVPARRRPSRGRRPGAETRFGHGRTGAGAPAARSGAPHHGYAVMIAGSLRPAARSPRVPRTAAGTPCRPRR
ncbi:hypothetical protein SAFG77S_13261 [Streptomyces afghaniensis]